jgi:tRNA pseudouridine32 synthase/23S rRNA pseudouridine746 synthase
MPSEFLKECILYQDDSIIVINKPANMPVHSGSGGGENLEQYLPQLCFGNTVAPILAHRLDRDTSGCLILGRHKEALRRVGKLFMAGRVTKIYWAVVEGGKFEKQEGRIDIPLRKQSPLKHHWWMEAHPDGQPSITDYKVIGQAENFTFLELYPRTGRTHQLRVHCKAIGSPIIGDKVYGNVSTDRPIMHLHARAITIPFYHNNSPIEVIAPPPMHMLELLQHCGYNN